MFGNYAGQHILDRTHYSQKELREVADEFSNVGSKVILARRWILRDPALRDSGVSSSARWKRGPICR